MIFMYLVIYASVYQQAGCGCILVLMLKSFIMVAFQLILIIQVVSVLQVKFVYKYR